MPNNSESRPPILDYQPVTKDCRRIPTWVVVFLVGFTVGVIWMLAALWQYSELSAPGWGIILACPGFVVGELFLSNGIAACTAACLTLGVSYGLLALSAYAVYRRLRPRVGGSRD